MRRHLKNSISTLLQLAKLPTLDAGTRLALSDLQHLNDSLRDHLGRVRAANAARGRLIAGSHPTRLPDLPPPDVPRIGVIFCHMLARTRLYRHRFVHLHTRLQHQNFVEIYTTIYLKFQRLSGFTIYFCRNYVVPKFNQSLIFESN